MRQLNIDVPDQVFKDFKIKLATKEKSMKEVILDFVSKYTYGVKDERPRDRQDPKLDG